jgi:MinD-like ATPase involved in chromosome partitioning or flagellar assembly
MTVPILTAVSGAPWEAQLVTALDKDPGGLHVVRRCVDLADLLAAAAAGHGRAVVVSADLRRLDREAVGRLAVAGVAAVGVVPDGDEDGERRLRQLGIDHVVTAGAAASDIANAVHTAITQLAGTGPMPAVWAPADDDEFAGPVAAGLLVAVWGPAGAPGRTALAVNLAAEIAALGRATLLVDADTYGGAVAQTLGLLDEAPGLASAARAANQGQLDLPALARHARQLDRTRLRVLTGIARTDRWPEIRPSSLEIVFSLARGLAEMTVADCGFCLELDEELTFDTSAPRRNGATITTLEQADTVLAVGSADPVGMQRLVRGLAELAERVPRSNVRVVVNRVRESVLGPHPERQVREALRRYAGVQRVAVIPHDPAAFDGAMAAGRTLAEVAPGSRARAAIAAIAAELAGVQATARPRRWKVLTR